MIVRNEGYQLADCLRPVAELFDEIIVIDTGSTDNTREVARQFTSQVFDFPWCDDFSAARNESLKHATGDWIFWLDADDRLSPENVAKLANCLNQLNGQPYAIFMNTACSTRYECEGASLITHTRLFRRHPELKWRGRVHEQLRPEVSSLGFEAVWSDVQIDHTGYQDPGLQNRKLQRDLRLLRMDYATHPDDTSTLLHLGLTYFHLGRFAPARTYLERLVTRTKEPSDHLRQVFSVLTTMCLREGQVPEALNWFDRALEIFPTAEDLLYFKAECLYDLDRYAEAAEVLTRIIHGPADHQYCGGVPCGIRAQRAPRKLADICRLQRNFTAAESLLMDLLQRAPHDTLTWHTLGLVFLDSRQRVKLLAVIEHLKACPQGNVFGLLLNAMWHLSAREFDAAGAAIDELIGLAPLMPMPRILRVEWLTQTSAPIIARLQACRDLLRLQPGNHEARRLANHLESLASDITPTSHLHPALVTPAMTDVPTSQTVGG